MDEDEKDRAKRYEGMHRVLSLQALPGRTANAVLSDACKSSQGTDVRGKILQFSGCV